jgi:hypothetical protein
MIWYHLEKILIHFHYLRRILVLQTEMSTHCPLHFLKAYATDLYNAQLETFQTFWQYQKYPQDSGNITFSFRKVSSFLYTQNFLSTKTYCIQRLFRSFIQVGDVKDPKYSTKICFSYSITYHMKSDIHGISTRKSFYNDLLFSVKTC